MLPVTATVMSWETYLAYLATCAVFFATPPDTSQLLVVSNSLRCGLRRSLATVAGDLSANCLQMTAAAFGLTAIVALSADILWIVKWLGVAYLLWIGIRLMLSKPAHKSGAAGGGSGIGFLFRQGFLTSSANPYAVVFFAALFPQFIDPAQAVLPQLLVLGLTYLVIDGVTLIAWGWAATASLGRIRSLDSVWINRICGALMVGAAGLLGFKDLNMETR